jgi:cell division protease FtsH
MRTFKDEARSEETSARVDQRVKAILDEQRARAKEILAGQKKLLVALRDLLLERKVLDREAFAHLV